MNIFGLPRALWMIALFVPLLSLFLWWSWRRKQVLMRQFVGSRLMEKLMVGVSPARQKVRSILLILAVFCLILALARPQWGYVWEEASQRGRDIVIAIDTSRSMEATDVPPDRLSRAKLAALDLLKLAKHDRLGLVAFAGSAFLQCPLTLDDEAFRQSVNVLESGIIPQGGTAIREAIEAALTAFNKENGEDHRILVLFTDGEDHEEGVMEAVKKASAEGLRIFTVGVGTAAGELLRVRDANGALNYVKDESGNVVKSKLNEEMLREIASGARGFYLPLQGADPMKVLYDRGLAPLPTTEFAAKLDKHYKLQFHWPLGLAMVLLTIEMLLPDQKRRSRTSSKLKEDVSLATFAGVLFLLVCGARLQASPSSAMRKYSAGDFKDALHEYEHLLEKEPNDPKLHYNAGAAAFQAKKYDSALKHFSEATTSPSLSLQEMAYYNMGSAEYRLGESESDAEKKLGNWEDAVRQYDSALKLNPNHADARFNHDLIQKKIEELKKKQQKDKKSKDKNKDQPDNKDEKNKDQDNKDNESSKSQKSDQNKSEQNKSDKDKQQEKTQDQSKQEQQQQKDQKDQEQQKDQAASQEKKHGDQKQAQKGSDGKQQDQDQQDTEAGQTGKFGQMTPEQARQLLEAQKSDERALMFFPPKRKGARQSQSLKDW